jgi:hypothetical protein
LIGLPIAEALVNIIGGRGEIGVLSCSESVKMLEVDGFNQ